jgi:L-rhamnose mutarotase
MIQKLLLSKISKLINKLGLIKLGLVIFFSLFYSAAIFAQASTGPVESDEVIQSGEIVEIKNAPPSNDGTEQAAEELARKNDHLNKTLKSFGNFAAPAPAKEASKFDPEKVIKDFAIVLNNELSPEQVRKMKMHEAVAYALKPIQRQSEQEIMTALLNNSKGTKNYEIFIHYPKITLFAVRLIKDPKALPDVTRIIENPKKMKNFAAVILCTILLGFVVARVFSSKDKGFVKALSLLVFRVVLMTSIRFFCIYYFFSEELGAAFNVLLKTFF